MRVNELTVYGAVAWPPTDLDQANRRFPGNFPVRCAPAKESLVWGFDSAMAGVEAALWEIMAVCAD